MDPKARFSDRVEKYVKYRPSYPPEVVEFILHEFQVGRDTVVADIGSGTGIFTRLLAGKVSRIYAVEPNGEMRRAAEAASSGIQSIVSVDGAAEKTNLTDRSIDLITCAQSFHWFDRERTKEEFRRVLRPKGKVLLLWYTRQMSSDFAREFDQVLKDFGKDYKEVDHRNITLDVLRTFFARGEVEHRTFPNVQMVDHDSLIGRLHSVSYCPKPGEENYDLLMNSIEDIFSRYNRDGIVEFDYIADLYWGSVH